MTRRGVRRKATIVILHSVTLSCSLQLGSDVLVRACLGQTGWVWRVARRGKTAGKEAGRETGEPGDGAAELADTGTGCERQGRPAARLEASQEKKWLAEPGPCPGNAGATLE